MTSSMAPDPFVVGSLAVLACAFGGPLARCQRGGKREHEGSTYALEIHLTSS